MTAPAMTDGLSPEELGLEGREVVHLVAAQATAEPGATVARVLDGLVGSARSGSSPTAIRLYRGMSLSPAEVVPADPAVRVTSTGILGSNRAIWEQGRLDMIPEGVSRVPAMLRSGAIGNDVFLVRATASLSTGVVNDYIPAALESAGRVIVEVCDELPELPGAPRIDRSRVDVLVPGGTPLPEFASGRERPEDRAIADRVAALVEDGACVQIGLGALGQAIVRAVAERRRGLGIHTGLIDDAVLGLIDSGAVTNAAKEVDPGQSVTPIVMGSAALYRRVHGRKDLLLRPVDHTNDPRVLAQISRFTSINSALQVDLLGQVNAETVDGRRIAAVGGQLEFFTGARLSPGGLAIAVLRATARAGRVSRIVPVLPDAVATVGAGLVDFVVSEYGVADLRGATLTERARRLAAIAHPDFRRGLLEALENDRRLAAAQPTPEVKL
jgi:acyl-CoA hydrolase